MTQPVHGMSETRRYAAILLALLVALALYRVWAAQAIGLELWADEAYYFGWAQTLEWGYYSKPPMVAWLIHGAMQVCGAAEPCLRLPSTLLYPATALVLFLLGSRLFAPRVGFWTAVAFITLPMVSFGSWFVTTDAPLLLFWALALYFLVGAMAHNRWRDWLGLGLVVGLGALSKYSVVFFGLGALAYLALSVDARRQLRNPRLYAALAVAVAVFAPNLVWNAQHQFISVEHTAEISHLSGQLMHPDQLAEFLGAQFLVFGPITFAVLLHLAMRHGFRLAADHRYVLLFAFSAPVLLAFLTLAFLSRALPNWGAMAYVAGIVLVTAWWLARGQTRWLYAAIGINVLLGLGLYHYQAIARLADVELTAKIDPYARVAGWRAFGAEAARHLAAHPDAKLLADDRKTLAELIYYARPHPFDARMYNPSGVIGDHYAMKQDVKDAPNGRFVFISRNANPERLAREFAQVELLGRIAIPLYPDFSREAEVYLLSEFRGYAQ